MSLVFKKSFREDVGNANVFIDDKSASSPNYFRVSDVPQILTKGKNLIRVSGHPTNLKDGTQVYIDIKDSNGNSIYYEIPDYIEDDKSRVLSIWIYHDKGDDNTANGEATITLVGIATKDENGRTIPPGYRNKINVRWQVKVNVDRDRSSITPILFNTTVSQPELSLSESIEVYQNQPQAGNKLNLTTQTGTIKYILKGRTPLVQITDGSTEFNQEMLKSSVVLSNYETPATPICKKGEPTNLNFFSGSIFRILNNTTAQLTQPYTAKFEDREGLRHQYDSIEASQYSIQYFQSGSNVDTENQRSFVNISFTKVDPIVGIVDKIKVLQKSDGLPGEFELLNEVSVPFTSSFSVKIPLPSENLQDPKLLKIQYLNSIGEISRTETTIGPFVFEGGNQYIGGSKNLISGSIFISNTLGSGLEIGGASSGFMRSVGFEGQTSASLGKAPGGFVIYSGSGNLQMGVDTLEGVGMQMIGDNDDRHFIFSTANGGNLDVKTDKFFIGTNNTQFISGSNSNIEISSSLFHLDPKNNSLVIGANATINADLSVNNIFSPAGTNISSSKAAITAQGFAKFTSASIGGIKLDDNKLFTGDGTYSNSNTGFYVDSGSQFSLGNKLVWNPTTQALVIRGQLQLSDGSDVGNALAAATSSNTSKTVALGASSYVVTFNSLGNQDPTGQSITLTATQQNHTGTVYYEFRKGGSLQGSRSTTNTFVADQSNELPTASTPVTYEVKTFEVSSGGTAIANDTLTLFGVQGGASGSDGSAGSDGTDGTDGQDAVTAFLTNEAHTFAANPDKSIVSFTGGSTNMIVFEGVTDKTNSYTYTRSSTTSVSSSINSNTVTITSMAHDSGSVVVTATSASTSLSKTMSLAKAIAGQTGSDGTDGTDGNDGLDGSTAKTLVATVDSQVMAFDDSTDTSATPTEVVFSFNQQNLNAAIASSDITVSTAGGNVTNFGFDNNGVTNSGGKHSGISSGSISFTGALNSGGLNSTKTNLPVTVSVSKDGLSDSIKVFKVEGGSDGTDGTDGAAGADGTDAVTTFLTNEAHTFTAQSDGTIISFVGGSTDMEVFEGVTNSTANYTISSSRGPGVTATDSGKTVTISGMTHDSGSVTITATSASVSLSKSMSLTKSKQGTAGLAGSNAKLLSLSSDSQVFSFPSASSSTAIDNDILVTINQQNLSGTVSVGDFTIVDSGGNTLSDPTLKASVTDGTGQVSGSITFSGTVGGNKTKLPLTVTVTKDSLEDSLKIFKVEGGSAGSDGTDGAAGADGSDAVTAFLTNESHTFPADNNGAIASFVGGSTEMEVFEGVTNRTSNYTISSSRGPGVVASDSGKTVTVSALGHDSGSLTITATSASVSLSKIMSLTKARQGGDGSDGTSAKLLIGSLDSQVFAFDNVADTSSDPLEIFFSFQQQNLTAAIVASDLTITTAGGSNITNFDFNNANISSGTGIVSGSIVFSQALNNGGAAGTKSNLPINISATKDGLQDSVKIFKVEGGTSGVDGQSARTMILTNESHTFASQPNGSIISFTGGDTDVSVFTGTTNTTSAYTISSTSTTSVSSSISSNTVTVTSMGHDSGSLIITAVSASGDAGEVSLSKLMSLTKAKQGTDGDDGAAGSNAKTITVNAASQIFVKAQNGTISPSSIVISANGQNLTQAGAFSTTAGTLTSKTENSSGGSATVTSGNFVDGMVVTYTTAGGDGSLTDSVTLKELDEGSGAVSALLTNESHVLPASSVGVVSSYSNSGTSIDVYEGATQLDYDGSGTSNGHWTIGTPTISPAGKITVGSISDSTNTAVVGNHSAMDNSTDSVTITYPISGKTQNGTAFSFNKTQTLTKSKAGTDGTNGTNGVNGTSAKLLTITPNSQVFGFDNSVDTTATPSSIIFTVAQQNLAHTIDTGDITITKAGSSTLSTPSLSGTISGGTGQQTFTVPFSSLNKSDLPLTVSVSNNANNLSDTTKIFKVVGGDTGSDGAAGSDAVTAFLTNEAHTFAALNNGTVVSFVGGSTDMEVFEGVTNSTSNYTISSSRGPGVVANDSGNTVTITALSHDSGSVNITATSASVSLTKTMSLVKSKQGTAGLAGADAKSVSIVADSQTFAFDNSVDTTATPSSVNFVVNQQNLSGTIATSDITITKAGGATFTTPSLGGSVSSGTGTRTFALPFSSFSKSDLPLNIAVSKDSLSDSSKIFKIVGGDTGSDGSAGSDAVTAFLTNESHTFAADFSGSIASFTGGSTDMEVFEGVTNKTSQYTFGRASTTSVSSSISSNTVTITSMNHDSGSVVVTATKGGTSLSKTMSVVKSKQGGVGATGVDGSNAKTVTTTAASQIFVKAQNGTITPSSIVITANGQNLTQNGAFTTTAGTLSSTSVSTSGGSTTVTSGNFVDGMVVTYTAHSNDGGLTDSITLKILDEGSGAVSALLTNESHVLPASSVGVVSSYSNSGTNIDVYEGATQLDYTTDSITNGHWTIGTPTVSPSGKITVGSISDSTNTAVVGNHSSMANDTDSVTITYPISGKTLNGTSFSFNKTQTITKSKAGTDGADGDDGVDGAAGSDSKTVSLTAASNVITYNAAGSSPSPSSTITLTATSQNFTNGFFKFTGDGISDETSYSNGSGANSDTFSFSVPSSYFSTPKSIRVGVSEANQSELAFDTVSIVAVQPGTDGSAGAPGSDGTSALTAFLTSDGDIVPAANDGTVSSFVGSGTEMIIFQGATDVSSAFNTVTRTNSTGLTSTLSGKTLTITGMNHDSGSVVITSTSASGDAGQVAISKTYSIGKSKAGATGDTGTAGSNAKTVTVGASSNIFVKAQNGTLSPSSITITANGQNLTANGAFSTTAGTLSSTSVSTSGGSTTVTSGNFSNGMVVTYTSAGADGSITDSVTLNELDEGSGNITAILDNEAHVLPASATGAVSSYANSGTTIRCFEGATALAFVTGTPGTGEFGVSVGNTANITEGSITDSGTFCTIGNHSGAADGTDQYVITYTISGKTLNGTDFTTFTKTQSLTKSKVGATGPQGNPGDNNQDFSFLDASLGVVNTTGGLSAGLLMTSNVFGFHNAISAGDGTNATLADFTSFLDSGGSFYLGGNSSGATNPTDGYFAWNNTDKSLLISGSKARIDVDKFFVGKSTTQFISGSNGNIEISSSKFHIKPDGDIIVKKVTADDGTIGGFTLSSNALTATNFELNPSGKRITLGTGNNIFIADGDDGIQLGHATFASAPFSVTKAGALKATSGTIGGFELTSTQINSTNDNLILKASGQVTASTLLLTGGKVAGMPVSSDEIAVGEVLKLKQSGQITGSSVQFSGGNIGGFQLENSSLFQGSGNNLIVSASFTILPRFGDNGTVPTFEYEPRIGDVSFYIDDIISNLPDEDLGLILKSDSIISGSKVSGGVSALFSSGSDYYNNSTHLAIVDSYDPVSKLLTLKPGLVLGHGADAFYQNSYYDQRRIFIVDGVTYSTGVQIGNAFNQSSKTTSFSIAQKDTSNLILSSSGELKAQSGNIGDFTISKSDIELITSIETKTELPDFRVYNSTTLPSDAINYDQASDNGGIPLRLYIKKPNNQYYDGWEVNKITTAGSNGTDAGFGNYIAIKSSASSSLNNNLAPIVYTRSELTALGINNTPWPYNDSQGASGYSYVPATTNTLGENENWYLEYFTAPTTVNGVSSGGIASGYPSFENALVSFLSQSIDDTPIKFTVLAHTASFVCRAESSDRAEAGLWINTEANFIQGVASELQNLPENNFQQAIMIDGGGQKAGGFGISTTEHITNQLLSIPNADRTNFWQNPTLYSPLGWPTKAGFNLTTEMHIDLRLINSFTSSITTGYLKNNDNASNYWNTTNQNNEKISDILKFPFLFSEELANDGASAEVAHAQLFEKMNGLFPANGWSNVESLKGNLSVIGMIPVQTASISIVPYANVIGGFLSTDGDPAENKPYMANVAYNESTFGFPLLATGSEGGSTAGFTDTRNTAQPGSGKHIAVLEKGFFLNPLWDKALSYSGNGVTGHVYEGELESPGNYNSNDVAWTRYVGNYQNLYGTTEDATAAMGLPFSIVHSYVTGSSALTSKAILKNAIYPDTIAIRGQIIADNDEEGASIGFELNNWLNGAYDDRTITSRISDTVINTNLSSTELNSFKSTFGNRAYTGVRFHFNHNVKKRFGDGTIRMGTTSGSFSEGSVLKISGSGAISSSNYFQKADGTVTGSKVSFLGGKISGSDMSITANEFDFKTDFGNLKGNSTTFELSSSLLNLTPKSLNVKGNIQAEQVYGQDTFLAGKIVNTGVTNPSFPTVKYNFPFVEVYSTESLDVRLATGSFILKNTAGRSTSFLAHTGSTIQGNHKTFTLSSGLHSTPQYLVSKTNDGVGYPSEFKSWRDISGVNNDYVFVSNVSATNASEASGSLGSSLIGNQLVLNHATASKILFNSASNAFNSITTNNINLYEILNSERENVNIQFAIRGTAHPSTGSFNGYNPEYLVEVIESSGSSVVWQKSYKDTKATHKNWAVFDIPMTDIATFYKQNIPFTSQTGSTSEGSYSGTLDDGLKLKISMRYSGSSHMATRLSEGTRFGGRNIGKDSFTLGFALTEIRMVEPVRITSLDTQTINFKDTYMTWHDNPATTGHYGNFVPEFTSSATTSSFALGAPKEKWDEVYLNLKQDNVVSSSVSGVENKFVRMDIHSGRLSFTSASAGSGGGVSSYSLPLAAAGTRGGVKIGYTESGKNYPVELDSEKMYVNVPWTDNNDNTFRTVTVDTNGNGSANNTLSSTETLMLKKGSNVSLAESAGVVTISSTNTTYSAGNNGLVPAQGTSGHFLKHDGTFGLPSYIANTDTNTNYYLDGITKSGNTLTFSVNGATNKTYTFGSNAFNSTTIPSITGLLPKSGGTMTGTLTTVGINMANNTLSNVGQMSFNDPGPNEGISWTSGNTKIYESPDDLTTNSAGNLQFVYGTTRRMTINSTGADVNGNLTATEVTASGNIIGASLIGPSFGAQTGAPDSTIWAVSKQYPTWGIFYDEGTPDVIQFKASGTTKATIALDTGTFTSTALSGTGNRMVIANASGVLSTQAIPSGGSTYSLNLSIDSGESTEVESGATLDLRAGSNVSLSKSSNQITIASTDTNTTYTAGGDYGLYLSGTQFRLEDDRRRNSSTTDIKTGNTHDYTWYDASHGIRWYTSNAEEMRLENDGDLHVDGDVIAFSSTVSDERLKDNIFTIKNPLDKIKGLRGVEYDWNSGSRKGKHDLGLIAQEVEKVIPEIVHNHTLPLMDDSDTVYKTVDYEKLTAVLIESVKEQSNIIEKLEERIKNLEKGSNN